MRGEDFMDIAALSIGLSQMQLTQQVNTSVMEMSLDTAKMQANDLTKMMEQSITPHLGSRLDISL